MIEMSKTLAAAGLAFAFAATAASAAPPAAKPPSRAAVLQGLLDCRSKTDGAERLAEIRRFYYEVAQQTNVVALGALRRVVPISQIVFGTDYPASDSGGKASPLVDHAEGLAGVFSGDDLRAVERENALQLFPKYRT